jgi:TolA-binding protein
MGPVTSLHWAELGVALLTICGVVYGGFRAVMASASNGYIDKYLLEPRRTAKNAHEQVDQVDQKVDDLDSTLQDVRDQQELQTDALIAVGESINNGADFDTESFKERAEVERADRFLDHPDSDD